MTIAGNLLISQSCPSVFSSFFDARQLSALMRATFPSEPKHFISIIFSPLRHLFVLHALLVQASVKPEKAFP
jgi:hypothetical protein